ncbi:hypothetical protein PTKIN_Ptkin14bG0104800 [Pterospermum kingtungense]
MEYVEPSLGIVNCIQAPVCECLQYHRKLKDYVKNLRRIRDELNSKMDDIALRLESERRHVGKAPRKEVENWLKNVKEMVVEAEDVEKKVKKGRYLLRACLGKLVDEKTQELQKILDKAPSVSDSLKEEVSKIGVWGMGGVGKTTIMKHIYNDLLEAKKFDQVIWVTVSKELNIEKLQDDIASALKEVLPEKGDKVRRAGQLLGMLKKAKKHVLILDAVWDRISLEDVGIPEPTSSNGCKLVLTTRKEEVCKFIGCDEECAGLPLTIVVVAGTLKGVDDPHIWNNALNELKQRIGGVEGIEAEVIERSKFSFDHLKDEKVKHCFLYCALYPEDFDIEKDEQIQCWIDEGFIDEMDTRRQMMDKGHARLKRLEDNCLLENAYDELRGECVKMHDAVRDMALSVITSMNHPRCMIKAGIQLKSLPKEEEWAADIEKVSVMSNSISEIPTHLSLAKCQLLTTLLLQENPIRSFPDPFFSNMPCLSVLNLSRTLIECLPDSISELKNLTALLLQWCVRLKHVPSLSKLQKLKKLDLSYSGMEEVPEGMETLVNLRYLDLYADSLMEVPSGLLPKLSRLQYLRFHRETSIKAERVVASEELEFFWGRFKDMDGFKKFVQSIPCESRLNEYFLQVGLDYWTHPEEDRVIKISQSEIRGDEILLPIDIQQLDIPECHSFRSLNDISCLKNAVDLRNCNIWNCRGIEFVLSISSFSSSSILFQSLEKLSLINLPGLNELIKVEGFASAGSPVLAPTAATFSHLKRIYLKKCSNIKKLFLHWLLTHLQILEEVSVTNCEQLVEILTVDDDEEKGTEKIKVYLPKLRRLRLNSLPELKSICSKSGVLVCDSLQKIHVNYCYKLKRIPPFLPLRGDGQPYTYAPSSLKIKSSREWWESLEWDHPNFKNVLQPLWQEKQYTLRHFLRNG